MHEMSIALEIIDIVVKSIPKNLNKNQVKKINIKIGKLSTIKTKNLNFCFHVAQKKSIIKNAKLYLKVIPVIIFCKNCKKTNEINKPVFKCKFCKSNNIKLISGRELDIVSIEIEKKVKHEFKQNFPKK